ncbi:hypothetical protein RHA1_ro08727 (plasmid) [Rhodococcus jostii RHA1]|uniref:Uncharacterized protein n=1 Tax=Rhodococcus jostii (strain RHA1) TaxID=101510 RepID=Q0RY65_RHOJR|nr:hypothetical protein RHA1_ro08727 [Rhodococcus jostii RHA1]
MNSARCTSLPDNRLHLAGLPNQITSNSADRRFRALSAAQAGELPRFVGAPQGDRRRGLTDESARTRCGSQCASRTAAHSLSTNWCSVIPKVWKTSSAGTPP